MKQVEEILKTLTLREKASLLSGEDFWHTKGIPEKGIPSVMVTDGPHGLRKQSGESDMLGINDSVPATCFPSAACVCNSWDEELIGRIGKALGEECQAEDVGVLLGPGNNIKRSPLCGRNFEYFSEDPYLAGHMAKSHINGVQSMGVGTSLKHFAVNNQETYRMSVDAVVDERTLREIYLAAFETAVKEAKPWTIMGAYNKVNGSFCCENHHLLREILRDEWGYEGVVVSDWGAVNDHVSGIPEGFDLRMPYLSDAKIDEIVRAVEEGRLAEGDLDKAVERVLTLVEKCVENHQEGASYDREAHHRLARQSAAESIVLLKNENHALPLQKGEKIALIGAFAKNIRYQGGGSSHINATFVPDMEEAFLEKLEEMKAEGSCVYREGFSLTAEDVDPAMEADAAAAVKEADRAVVCIGLPDGWESEGYDRAKMDIPANQIHLLKKLSETGKPVIAVLFCGAPVTTEWTEYVDALLVPYTGGQAVAQALTDVLWGTVNPCGKLGETWPLKMSDTPCFLTYPQKKKATYEEGVFVGYRYYEKKQMPVAFPFGFGLSYTEFSYGNLQIEKDSVKDTETVKVRVDVTNTGKAAGKEIVQLYVGEKNAPVPRPVKELKGFRKISLEPGETKAVEFTLDKRSFAYYDEEIHDWYAPTGSYEISVGASSTDIRLSGEIQIVSTAVRNEEFTVYSSLEELLADPVAVQVMGAAMGGAFGGAQGASEENPAAAEGAAMAMTMPMIKIAGMSGGAFPEEAVYQMIGAINAAKKNASQPADK